MFAFIKELHQSISARFASYFRKREVLAVARNLHMTELATTPVNLHPLMRAQHKFELAGIRAGNLSSVNRRTMANVNLPTSFARANTPVVKQVPISLRRFSRTPVPARAINIIKAGLLALPWDVRVIEGKGDPTDPDIRARVQIIKDCLSKPNNDDSFRSFTEQVLTDFLVYGMGVAEMQANPHDDRPFKMWAVDASTIQIVPDWAEDKEDTYPRYAQVAPFTASVEPIYMLDDEIMAIRDNIATDTPFGTGCLEIAHQAVNDLLSVQRMAGIAGNDQLGRQIFWWTGAVAPATMHDMREYLQNELEGMSRVGMVGGGPKPEVIAIQPVSINDLLLPWQDMLIRMIANSFNMSAMSLSVQQDVNRSTGEVLSDMDFQTAIVPIAKRFQESITRRAIHIKAGFHDLEFFYTNTEDPDLETKTQMLQTLYNSNGETANGMRKALGLPALNNPFADLTLFELTLIQGAAKPPAPAGAPTDPNADPNAAPGAGFSQPAGLAEKGTAKIPPTKKIALKKLPTISPTKKIALPKVKQFSAEVFAMMSPAMVKAAQKVGALPPSGIDVADQMEQEQPGVLSTLSEQVWEYLDGLAKKEIESSKDGKTKLDKKWTDLAKKRYGNSIRRVKKMEQQKLQAAQHRGSSQSFVTPKRSSRHKKLSY